VRSVGFLIWIVLGAVVLVAAWLALTSPLLQWRDPIYIVSGFAGVVALSLLLFQPLLAVGFLSGVGIRNSRRIHLWVGSALVLAVVIHVAGLWLTSPPDVVDALLFRSPTQFSLWGVLAMWALFCSAVLVVVRRKFSLRLWWSIHRVLALVIVVGTVVHAMLIEGTMEVGSKAVLCLLVVVAITVALSNSRVRKSK